MNTEAQMTNDEGNPNPEWRRTDDTVVRHLVIRHSFGFRHLTTFLIPVDSRVSAVASAKADDSRVSITRHLSILPPARH
jgi:hypothetical protein